jgi:hypothetical protein
VNNVWASLIPLIIGSALVPIQIVITTLLLRSASGKMTAVAWVAGMTTVRLGQGLVFGAIVGSGNATSDPSAGPGEAVSLLLLVVAILFYVTALKQILGHPDEDAPPPKWMAMIEGVTPARAFALGVGIMLIGAKFWVFTLGAISVIVEAGLGRAESIVAFVLFVVLAESIVLTLILVAYLFPTRSAAFLDRVTGLLATYNRPLMIGLGLVFGTWFMIKALSGLGIL